MVKNQQAKYRKSRMKNKGKRQHNNRLVRRWIEVYRAAWVEAGYPEPVPKLTRKNVRQDISVGCWPDANCRYCNYGPGKPDELVWTARKCTSVEPSRPGFKPAARL